MIKDDLIKNIHKIMRQDPFINEMFNAAGLSMDNIESAITDLEAQYWIDTATWGLTIWEKLLAIKTDLSKPLDDRRSMVEAKWKGDGKSDIYLLQLVADSWLNGSANVEFIAGKIKLTFNGIYGIPNDLDTLLKAIGDVQPCHLALIYAFNYFLIKDIHNVMTITQIQTMQLNKFAGGA